MAIIFDSSSKGTVNMVSSMTVAHTCTGSNLGLAVSICWGDNATTISGVTYNGVAMTKTSNGTKSINSYQNDIWEMVSPSTGTNDIVVTWSGTMADYATLVSASYTGVSQTGQPDSSNGASTASGLSLSVSDTTVLDNCMLVSCFMDVDHTVSVLVPGVGQTERNQQAATVGFKSALSDKLVSTAGSQTMDYSQGGTAGRLLHTVMAFAPVGATITAPVPTMLLMGVGL